MADLQEELLQVLTSFTGAVVSHSILQLSIRMGGIDVRSLSQEDSLRLGDCIEQGVNTFIRDPEKREVCLYKIRQVIRSSARHFHPSRETGAEEVSIVDESDILRARTIGHAVVKALAFSNTDQTKIVTVISELARNIFTYAGNGTIRVTKLAGNKRGVEIVARDSGPGIKDVEKVMTGHYRSTSGLGIGLSGSKRLMDDFSIRTEPGKGTTVTARKYLA